MGGICPEIVRSGNKIYEMRLEKKGVITPCIMRDSWNIMAQPLSALVSAYELDCVEKMFFPYLWNRPENYTTHLPHLPPKWTYQPDTMGESKRKLFDAWYEKNR